MNRLGESQEKDELPDVVVRSSPWFTWVAFIWLAYAGVVIALTSLKSFFQIGLLWKPENQQVQELRLVPLEMWFSSSNWFGPVFDTLGNLILFVPIGFLLVALTGRLGIAIVVGFTLSLFVEINQYVFQLGRTDINDLLFNTLGAALGGWMGMWGGSSLRREASREEGEVLAVRATPENHLWQNVFAVLVTLAVCVFVVLVILGPNLGDPSRVVELR